MEFILLILCIICYLSGFVNLGMGLSQGNILSAIFGTICIIIAVIGTYLLTKAVTEG